MHRRAEPWSGTKAGRPQPSAPELAKSLVQSGGDRLAGRGGREPRTSGCFLVFAGSPEALKDSDERGRGTGLASLTLAVTADFVKLQTAVQNSLPTLSFGAGPGVPGAQ